MEKIKKNNVRESLVSLVSKNYKIPENLVDKVITWTIKEAKQQLKQQSSIELTGFGTYLIYPSKLRKIKQEKEKMLEVLANKKLEVHDKKTTQFYIDSYNTIKEYLEFINKVENEFNSRMDKSDT